MTNKTATPKQKKYFDVRIECLCPTTITYRVYAFDEDEAIRETKKRPPTNVRPNILQKRDIKATVNDAGSLLIKKVVKY
jgi:hypothetical protein